MTRSTFACTGVAIWFCLGALHSASATTTNLVAVADTALRSSTPDNNFGKLTTVPVGVAISGSPRNRGLFKFDLTAVPADAVVTSATLRLVLAADPTPPADFDVYRLLQDWGEGDKNVDPRFGGALATAGEATWNARLYLTASWVAGGGEAGSDYDSAPSITVSLSGVTNEFSSPGLVADVQRWVGNPGTNYGWILLATGEPASTGKLIASHEDPDPNHAPVLIVEYSATAPATPPVISGVTPNGNQIGFFFDAQAGRTYAVEFCDSLAGGVWGVLTNVPAQAGDATIQVSDTISASERYFRVRTP